MFIVSQKSNTVICLNNVQILRVNTSENKIADGNENALVANCISGESEVVLGYYKTYQKALDQLAQIVIDYVDGKKIFIMPADE